MLETAIVLAAGEGTRLRPLTDRIPKVMLRVGGRPLLFHTLSLLEGAGIRRVGINLHHLGETIRDAIGDGRRWGIEVTYSEEPQLLGSAGAVGKLAGFIGDRRFALLYGDVLTDLDLGALARFHTQAGAALTMALTTAEDPRRCGVVETASDGRVLSFVEKPEDAEPDATVNAGIYVCEPSVMGFIPGGPSDFGQTVIPAMVEAGERIFGFRTAAYFQDIGTPEGYRLAEATCSEGRLVCRSS